MEYGASALVRKASYVLAAALAACGGSDDPSGSSRAEALADTPVNVTVTPVNGETAYASYSLLRGCEQLGIFVYVAERHSPPAASIPDFGAFLSRYNPCTGESVQMVPGGGGSASDISVNPGLISARGKGSVTLVKFFPFPPTQAVLRFDLQWKGGSIVSNPAFTQVYSPWPGAKVMVQGVETARDPSVVTGRMWLDDVELPMNAPDVSFQGRLVRGHNLTVAIDKSQ